MTPLEQKARRAAYMRQWRRQNPEASRAASRRRDQKVKEDPERRERYRQWRNAYMRQRYQTHREQVRRTQRNSYLRCHFGIEPEEYDRFLAEQQGGCAICESPPRSGKKYLAVDHDHGTGEVRGLLCDPCNRALGLLGDTAERLARALAYLSR